MVAASSARRSCSPAKATSSPRPSCPSDPGLRCSRGSALRQASRRDDRMPEPQERSLGHRIINFPPVALVASLAFFLLARVVALWLGQWIAVPGPASALLHAAISL